MGVGGRHSKHGERNGDDADENSDVELESNPTFYLQVLFD